MTGSGGSGSRARGGAWGTHTIWGGKNVEKADSRGWGLMVACSVFLFHNSTRVPPYPFFQG